MRKTIDKSLETFLILLMAVMVINVLWQVFSRFILQEPSSFTDELARFLLIWVGVLGATLASGKKLHIAINLLSTKLNIKQKRVLRIVNNLIIVAFALCVLVIGGGRLVYITYVLDQYSPSLQLPLAVVYLVLPISGLLVSYYKLSDIFNDAI